MPVYSDRLEYLLQRNVDKACSKEELRELYSYIQEMDDEAVYPFLDALYQQQDIHAELEGVDWDHIFDKVIQARRASLTVRKTRIWQRIAVAASLLVMLGVGGYFIFFNSHPNRTAETVGTYGRFKNDIAPGANKAILTLSDGSKVALDSAGRQVIQQGATAIHQQGGQLQYNAQGAVTSMQYNILATPRGGQFQVTLPDGSRAWLNAASSLRYPTAFTGPERVVEVTGEAYFDVANNARQPFVVRANNTEVQVLGTVFNINAYQEEESLKTTLVSGLIKVSTSKGTHLLRPGKTATVSANGNTSLSTADIKAVTAWKNGYFQFDNADIQSVMRQLERWYDIEVIYEGPAPGQRFGGGIQRSLPLSEVLTILEKSKVRYKIEGRKLIIY